MAASCTTIDAKAPALAAGGPKLLYLQAALGGHAVRALVDSGAGLEVITEECAERCNFALEPLTEGSSSLKLADGSLIRIAHFVRATLELSTKSGPINRVSGKLAVGPVPGADIVLGLSWLKAVNPVINWQTHQIVGFWTKRNSTIDKHTTPEAGGPGNL